MAKLKSLTWRLQPLTLAIVSSLALSTSALANDPTGRVYGHLSSESGQSVSGAEVLIKHNSKGFERSIVVNENGDYELKALPIGEYTIIVKKAGFETEKYEHIVVNVGSNTALDLALHDSSADRIEVVGARPSPIDTQNASSGVVITQSDLDTLPIAENLNAIGLLAPGAVASNSQFGNLVSFSGASAAENGFYLNGLNVTDLRKGMGYVYFPQEVIQETEIITGGVSAKYGRFIGGVTNAVSKSGNNDWRFSAEYFAEPESWRTRKPSYFGKNSLNNDDLIVNNHEDRYDYRKLTLSGSGALVQDKAFIYAAFAKGNTESTSADPSLGLSKIYHNDDDDQQAFINIDWYLSENHSFNAMYMRGSTDYIRGSSAYTFVGGEGIADADVRFDDETTIESLRYNGQLTSDLSVSATVGKVEYAYNATDGTLKLQPIFDARSGTEVPFGNWVGQSKDINGDRRQSWRVDFEWRFDDHTIEFGVDNESLKSWRDFGFHGPNASHNELLTYRRRATPSGAIQGDNGSFILPAGDHIRGRDFSVEGETKGSSNSLYLGDRWQINDRWLLSAGVRNETFTNETAAGEEYVKVDDQWAPRLSVIWDVFGNGQDKAFVNFGRYFQPVAQNTSIRMTALETNRYRYYTVAGSNPDGSLVVGNLIGSITYADGTIRPGEVYAATNLKPMYEDEVSVGWEHQFNDDTVAGVRLLHRQLQSSIEDAWVTHGLLAYCADAQIDCSRYENDVAANSNVWNGGNARIINPGEDVTVRDYLDGDDVIDTITIPQEYLGYPSAKRHYNAIELTLRGKASADLRFDGSFTYSKSEGNTEGLLRSDNGQADPGWTRSFDSPGLVDNGYGLLPNDHKYSLKLRALYTLNSEWSMGLIYRGASGSPINAFGTHPLDQGSCASHFANAYCLDSDSTENFYVNGQASPRGSHGRTPWVQSFDFSVNYVLPIAAGRLSASLDVFNVFNSQHVTRVNEYGERGGSTPTAIELNPQYGQPQDWQSPRYVAATLRYEF